MNCTHHAERPSTVTCHGCSKPFCDGCVVRFEKLFLCADCKAKFLTDVDPAPRPARPAPATNAPAGPRSAPVPTPEPPRAPRAGGSALPWIGGGIALLFALVFSFVIVASLAAQYRSWSADRRLADAFSHVAEVGAALERYHLDSGKYPDELKTLVPKYLKEVPGDPFGGSLRYSSDPDTGRRVWSIGPDEKDDQGAPPADIALLVEEPSST